jgi:hypothetical protein
VTSLRALSARADKAMGEVPKLPNRRQWVIPFTGFQPCRG